MAQGTGNLRRPSDEWGSKEVTEGRGPGEWLRMVARLVLRMRLVVGLVRSGGDEAEQE